MRRLVWDFAGIYDTCPFRKTNLVLVFFLFVFLVYFRLSLCTCVRAYKECLSKVRVAQNNANKRKCHY